MGKGNCYCAGTFISTILFGLITYFLVLIGVVRRSHLGPAPLVECMLYGESAFCPKALNVEHPLQCNMAPPSLQLAGRLFPSHAVYRGSIKSDGLADSFQAMQYAKAPSWFLAGRASLQLK